MSDEAFSRPMSSIASASIQLNVAKELNENYWPSDGIEYRTCSYCGVVEKCSRGSAPRACKDCDDPELMGIYDPDDYSWLFQAA